jgi:nucleotide-binding universal stress UspA family protein
MATFEGSATEVTSVVLVGVDFTASSREALATAENLARAAPKAELHLVHALAMPVLAADPQELFAQGHKAFDVGLAKARTAIDQMAAAATHGIGRVTGHVRVGSPSATIVSVASDVSADLIVVGSGHRSVVSRIVFGSVAEKIARIAPCPVLVVKPKEIPMWQQIEPPCPDCAHVQRETKGERLWCARHSQHHPRWHTYHEAPASYGIGSLTFRN